MTTSRSGNSFDYALGAAALILALAVIRVPGMIQFGFSLALISLAGYPLSSALAPKADLLERIVMSFIYGASLASFLLYVSNMAFHISVNLPTALCALVLCAASGYLLKRMPP